MGSLTLFLPDGHGDFVGSRFLFCLFPKLLGIQITCSRYLKVCADLPKDNWNTFRTIGDLLETFSSKEKPLLSCTMSGQNLKKFTFLKDGFPDGHNNHISFLVGLFCLIVFLIVLSLCIVM